MGWEELPAELLDAILRRLTESADHIRFSCVCRSWRSTARSQPVPPSLPWLQLPHNPTSSNLEYYSLSEDRVYKISLPEVVDSQIIGSSHGFLLIISNHPNNTKVVIANPFTGLRLDLPSEGLPAETESMVWDYSGSVIVRSDGANLRGAAYCRPGASSWTRMKPVEGRPITSIVYGAGTASFFLLDQEERQIFVLGSETPNQISRVIQLTGYNFKYLDWIISSHDDSELLASFRQYFEWIGAAFFDLNTPLEDSTCLVIRNYNLNNYFLFQSHSGSTILVEASRLVAVGLQNNLHSRRIFTHTETCKCSIFSFKFIQSGLFTHNRLFAKCNCVSDPILILPDFTTK